MPDKWCTSVEVLIVAPQLKSYQLGQNTNDNWNLIIEEATQETKYSIQSRYETEGYGDNPPETLRKMASIWAAFLALRRFGGGLEGEDRLNELKEEYDRYKLRARNGSLLNVPVAHSPAVAIV